MFFLCTDFWAKMRSVTVVGEKKDSPCPGEQATCLENTRPLLLRGDPLPLASCRPRGLAGESRGDRPACEGEGVSEEGHRGS